MKVDRRRTDALSTGVSFLGGVADYLVLLLVALFAYELVARNVFAAPTGFADQLAAYALPAITFLAFARSLRPGGHVTVSVVVDHLGPRGQRILRLVSLALEVVVCAAVTMLAIHTVIGTYEDGVREFIGQTLVHEYLPLLVIPVGFALATLQCLRDLVRELRAPSGQGRADP